MKGIRTVLLDVDGTLLDTSEYIFAAVEHTLKEHRLFVPGRDVIGKAVGLPFDDFYQQIIGRTDIDLKPIKKSHHEFQITHPELSRSIDGVSETLEALRGRGMKLAGVTNRRRGTAIETLTAAGLDVYLDACLCGDDVPFGKPDPRHLFAALDALSGTPESAVMVGDADVDIEAGKRAGVRTIRVTYGFHGNESEVEPDLFIDDFRKLLEILN